jgi:hypothetical protein
VCACCPHWYVGVVPVNIDCSRFSLYKNLDAALSKRQAIPGQRSPLSPTCTPVHPPSLIQLAYNKPKPLSHQVSWSLEEGLRPHAFPFAQLTCINLKPLVVIFLPEHCAGVLVKVVTHELSTSLSTILIQMAHLSHHSVERIPFQGV